MAGRGWLAGRMAAARRPSKAEEPGSPTLALDVDRPHGRSVYLEQVSLRSYR